MDEHSKQPTPFKPLTSRLTKMFMFRVENVHVEVGGGQKRVKLIDFPVYI